VNKFICLLTIHGIGFEEPPHDGIPGYADSLHEHLSKKLDKSILGDDPLRSRSQRGQNGPIYIQSFWPPGSENMEPELARLGNWDDQHGKLIDISKVPLAENGARIVHIALVYSHLEGKKPRLEPLFHIIAMGAFSLRHYARTRIMNVLRIVFSSIPTLFKHQPQTQDGRSAQPSLRVRSDSEVWHARGSPTGLFTIIKQLENDVAAYVCFNDRRERVRSFVREAIFRLAYREDVAGIVVNAHSNGTVVAFDVLRELPPDAAAKVLGFITAGSPLLKYTDLFHWGNEVGSIQRIKTWMNFCDPNDPVADPLNLPDSQHSHKKHRWMKKSHAYHHWLYQSIDPRTGHPTDVDIANPPVDNVKNSLGGGLQAHNYWDNDPDFIQQLVRFLQQLVASEFNQPPASRNNYAG